MNRNGWIALSTLLLAGACTDAVDSPTTTDKNKAGIDVAAFAADGKGDFGRKAKLLEEVGPEATINGEFDPRIRVYGYVVDAGRGATIRVSLAATAGADAEWLKEGEELDTMLGVYGPWEGPRAIGELIDETDDSRDSLVAPPIDFEVEADGKFLVAFSSWDDTGTGDYQLDITCEGTDFQCRRPDFKTPCQDGQLFVQGGSVDVDTEWDTCEVILLEPTVVAEDVTLTIKPGVAVKSNYLSPAGANYGSVMLNVLGTLQAAGTEEDPIHFTALTERGWRGLFLGGNGHTHTVQHAFIDKSEFGISLQPGAVAEISDVVLDGRLEGHSDRGRMGVQAHGESRAMIQRVLIKNYQSGVHTQGPEDLIVEDSVIRANGVGVQINGERRSTSCGTTVRPPARWRDPVIRHSDIYGNEAGIQIDGSDALLQVEFSNIIDNEGGALTIRGTDLHVESFLRNNNITGNNGGTQQVRSFHRSGQVDISWNYWEDISDPGLSENWTMHCRGAVDFSGFHPLPVDTAGPRLDTLVDTVRQDCVFAEQAPRD